MATAIQWLDQRRDEDWLRAWQRDGKLYHQLSAQGLAQAARKAQAWLEQQDWSESRHGCGPGSSPWNQAHSAVPPPERAQPVVLLVVADAGQFLTWFCAITSLGYPLFLGDPAWGWSHWQQVHGGLGPDLVISDVLSEGMTDGGKAIANQLNWCPWPVDNADFGWEKAKFSTVFEKLWKTPVLP